MFVCMDVIYLKDYIQVYWFLLLVPFLENEKGNRKKEKNENKMKINKK